VPSSLLKALASVPAAISFVAGRADPGRAPFTSPRKATPPLLGCENVSLTALPTPFAQAKVDEHAFARFVDWQIESGRQGLVVGGAIGEGTALPLAERVRLIELAVEASAKRVPIIAVTGTNCTQESVELTRAAEEAGANAALLVAPYYNRPNQEGVYAHFCQIARSVELPLILEADPGRTGIDIHAETLERLAKIPNIVGIEEAEGGPFHVRPRSIEWRSDFLSLTGDDADCVDFRMAGGRGSISILANLVPAAWTALQRAMEERNWERAKFISERLRPLSSALRLETNPAPLKYALSLLHSWFNPEVRLPLTPITEDTAKAIREALARL